jgi:hypothetical protein
MKSETKADARRHARRMYKRVKSLASWIADEYGMTEQEAISEFYRSQLYSLLSDENTKVWWFSTPVLIELYKQERQAGTLDGAPYIDGLVG